ncbi:MAG TPA: SRPBCC domain-containing protein [Vicinamibacterales bacterium]
MATDTKILDVTRTQLIQAPPARVMQAFFSESDLQTWWQITRAFMVPRPLGIYAIAWESTDFKDEVLGRLGGAFHGTIMDYRANAAFFLAEAYWQPPDGDPIGPMMLEVHCRPHGNGRATTVTVKQSGEGEGPRWERYFDIMGKGWDRALEELKHYFDRETERTRLHRSFDQPK